MEKGHTAAHPSVALVKAELKNLREAYKDSFKIFRYNKLINLSTYYFMLPQSINYFYLALFFCVILGLA